MLTYRKLDQLMIIKYSDFDFFGYNDSRKSTIIYINLLTERVTHVRVLRRQIFFHL